MAPGPSSKIEPRLPPRDPRGGRPTNDVAIQLGFHILDVALDCFVAGGVEGTSMEAIAAAAHISKRTLYSRFGSKLALLVAAIEHGLSRHFDPIPDSVPRGPVRRQIVHVARRLLDISLLPEVVGIESLIVWLAGNRAGLLEAKPAIGAQAGISMIRTILEQQWRAPEDPIHDVAFLACHLFDALVTAPRHRILFRHDLRNTAKAKKEYIERTTDLIALAIPLLGPSENAG